MKYALHKPKADTIELVYEAYMPVIVTTNCGTEELTRSLTPAGCSERNAQKMIDRLREMCLAVPLDGPSWRAK